jgi:hypothetical protein
MIARVTQGGETCPLQYSSLNSQYTGRCTSGR